MVFKNVNLRKSKPADTVRLFSQPVKLSKPERKDLEKIIDQSIRQGLYPVAVNAIIIAFLTDGVRTYDLIRKRGLFRYSNYPGSKCIISSLSAEIVGLLASVGYSNKEHIHYLRSIIILGPLHATFRELKREIQQEIEKFTRIYKDKSLVKSLLSFAEYAFLSNHQQLRIDDLNDLECRSKEDISDAVSYLIYWISSQRKLTNLDTYFVAEEYILKGEINHIVLKACLLRDLKEIEISIDHFQFTAKREKDIIKIVAPTEGFLKSMRLGFIRDEIQSSNDLKLDMAIMSIKDLANELLKIKGHPIFKLSSTMNYERYRLEIPPPINALIFEKFLIPDSLFREEAAYLSVAFKEQHLSLEDIDNIKVKDDLTILKFCKIKRLIFLLQHLFAEQIYIKEQKSALLFRSLIPAVPLQHFYDWLAPIATPNQIDEFLDIVCWDEGREDVFDLQYQSIVYMNDSIMIPLTIFMESNTIRNLYAVENRKSNSPLISDGASDPVSKQLKEAFTSQGIVAEMGINFSGGDVDVFAVMDNTLLVFECKQTLLPTSNFEMRTLYDHIIKAISQLNKIKSHFEAGKLLPELASATKMSFKNVTRLVSCIVLSNRIFNGNSFEYPIRNIHEISNFIERGTIRLKDGTFSMWRSGRFDLDELEGYFGVENTPHTLMMDSLTKDIKRYKFRDFTIEENTYYLNREDIEAKLAEFSSQLMRISE